MADLLDKVKSMVVEHLDVDQAEVTLNAGLKEDLGADSLDLVNLVMALEEEFEIDTISDEDAEKIQTVGDIVDYIKLKQESSA